MLKAVLRAVLPRTWRLRASVFRGGDFAFRIHLARLAGRRVLWGPFVGLRYPAYSIGSEYFPKILGLYESELHGIVQRLSSRRFARIAIAGAGEGYYVGGLAMQHPGALIESFELDPEGRKAIDWMAVENGFADRLRNQGLCDSDSLERFLSNDGDALLIMDVEGAEEELLDPERVPALLRTWILVEVHDCFRPGLDRLLRERFAASHHLEEVPALGRVVRDAEVLPLTAPDKARVLPLLDEKRPPGMRWFVLGPRLET